MIKVDSVNDYRTRMTKLDLPNFKLYPRKAKTSFVKSHENKESLEELAGQKEPDHIEGNISESRSINNSQNPNDRNFSIT